MFDHELHDLLESYNSALCEHGENLERTDSPLAILNYMLPGLVIITNPELLSYVLTSTHDERGSTNDVAHPSLDTIQDLFDVVSDVFRQNMPKSSFHLLNILHPNGDNSRSPQQMLEHEV